MHSIWYATFGHTDKARPEQSIVGVASDEFPDKSVVDFSKLHDRLRLPPRWIVLLRHCPPEKTISQLLVRDHDNANEIPMWFVHTPEPQADPPAYTLVAFSSSAAGAGEVLTAQEVLDRGLSGSHQVGAIRWWTDTGQIHQIYVAPTMRRSGVGKALVHAAAAVRVAHGWPSLWSDGQRTDLGEAFVLGGPASWQHRYETRTHNLAPMTPADRDAPKDTP